MTSSVVHGRGLEVVSATPTRSIEVDPDAKSCRCAPRFPAQVLKMGTCWRTLDLFPSWGVYSHQNYQLWLTFRDCPMSLWASWASSGSHRSLVPWSTTDRSSLIGHPNEDWKSPQGSQPSRYQSIPPLPTWPPHSSGSCTEKQCTTEWCNSKYHDVTTWYHEGAEVSLTDHFDSVNTSWEMFLVYSIRQHRCSRSHNFQWTVSTTSPVLYF